MSTRQAQEREAGPARYWAIPLRTRVVTEQEDLPALVARYTRHVARPGDAVALSESMVAIAQGRAVRPESVRPRLLARVLCRFAHPDGSLATPAAMELALREAGTGRILLAAAAALAGRLLRRRGWFYRVAGHGLRYIDDIGGTLAPYDRHIVLGPVRTAELAEAIRQATGLDVLIVDANSLGNVDVVAYAGSQPLEELVEVLKANPQGNDDEQTPIVLLRKVPPPPGP
ncbi:MAG TPA: hypothetical protein VIL11_03295 [Limnochordales bacterium]